VIEMVRDGLLPQQGFLKQEDIPLESFFATRTGALYLESGRS
jgi:saccharopine dehydrogenase (NAD+, L-lysine-forming)